MIKIVTVGGAFLATVIGILTGSFDLYERFDFSSEDSELYISTTYGKPKDIILPIEMLFPQVSPNAVDSAGNKITSAIERSTYLKIRYKNLDTSNKVFKNFRLCLKSEYEDKLCPYFHSYYIASEILNPFKEVNSIVNVEGRKEDYFYVAFLGLNPEKYHDKDVSLVYKDENGRDRFTDFVRFAPYKTSISVYGTEL